MTACWLPNHSLWADPDVKAVIGQKLATWARLSMFRRERRLHPWSSLRRPCRRRAPTSIATSRMHRKATSCSWAVLYFTAHDLADALLPLVIVYGHDVKDRNHISLFCGCTGELVWGWGFWAGA